MNQDPNSYEAWLDAVMRGLKAMYVDSDAVTGEELIYNWDEAKAAITAKHEAEVTAARIDELKKISRKDQRHVVGYGSRLGVTCVAKHKIVERLAALKNQQGGE